MGKYAIFIVFALIFSLLTYSSALRNAIVTSNTRVVESHGINQAYNIAQGSAMIVIKDIFDNNDDSSFYPEEDENYSYPSSTGFHNWEEMKGSYNIFTSNQGDSLLIVQSIGRFDETEYRVRVGLIKIGGSTFAWPPIETAVHADEDIRLTGSGTIQGDASTNSTNNGAVFINGGAGITGNLAIGPGGDPDAVLSKPDWHSGPGGTVFPLEEEYVYELPEYPEFPTSLPAGSSFESKKWNDPTNLPLAQYQGRYIPEIEVGSNRTITIEVGNSDQKLYVGNFDIKNGHVNLVGSGKLEIYIQNDITLGAGSTVNCNNGAWNCTGETGQLMTYYGGSSKVNFAGGTAFNGNLFVDHADVKLSGGNSFRGNLISGGTDLEITGGADATSAFYAPNADVKFGGGGNLSGFVVSKTFTASGGTWVYDDDLSTELPELEGGSGGGSFIVSYWN